MHFARGQRRRRTPTPTVPGADGSDGIIRERYCIGPTAGRCGMPYGGRGLPPRVCIAGTRGSGRRHPRPHRPRRRPLRAARRPRGRGGHRRRQHDMSADGTTKERSAALASLRSGTSMPARPLPANAALDSDPALRHIAVHGLIAGCLDSEREQQPPPLARAASRAGSPGPDQTRDPRTACRSTRPRA